jgi:hypothetical protein
MDKGINRAFLDLLFNCLLGFVFLFIVSFALVEIDKKKANIETKAEFVIILTWDFGNTDDVDTYLKDPNDAIVWFSHKSDGLMHLDRDDLGISNDSYYLPDGTCITYPYNQEITTIRGIIPGIWALNIHMYNKREQEPTNVRVEVQKLNPVCKTFIVKDYVMKEKGEEITVARFEVGIDGDVLAVDEQRVEIVKELLRARGGPGGDM